MAVLWGSPALLGVASNSEPLNYYVRPEADPKNPSNPGDPSVPGDSCGLLQPCHTLSEYQRMSRDSLFTYHDDVSPPDVVLTFLPGRHVLDDIIVVVGANSFTVTGREERSGSSVIDYRGFIQPSYVDVVVFRWLTFTTYDEVRYGKGFLFRHKNFLSINISNCIIEHFSGYFLHATGGTVTVENTAIVSNTIATSATFLKKKKKKKNVARDDPTVIAVYYGQLELLNNTIMYNNVTKSTVIYTIESSVVLNGNVFSENGGGDCRFGLLHNMLGTVTAQGTNTFFHNYHSVWFITSTKASLEGTCEFHSNSGCNGPFSIVGLSEVSFSSTATFINNTASIFGGAMALSSNSIIRLFDGANVMLVGNSAVNRGGAIYVDDSIHCFFIGERECFIQIGNASNFSLYFENNKAGVAGDDIYGGKIETCIQEQNSNIRSYPNIQLHHDTPTLSSVSSDALQICLCDEKGLLCCPSKKSTYPNGTLVTKCPAANDLGEIFPGENITFHLMPVGQYLGATSSGILVYHGNALTDVDSPIVSQQLFEARTIIEPIPSSCTIVEYAINCTAGQPQYVSLFPFAQCELSDPLVLRINVSKSCPPGFGMSKDLTCTCDSRFRDLGEVSCEINRQTIQHKGSIWLGFSNSTTRMSGLIIHSSPCPFYYCISNEYVTFTLNETNKQCAHNRSGLLCGRCAEGLSVMLGGSSQCQQCSNAYVALLIPFALAGPALLVCLFVLQLTVPHGTMNGLIFYANAIQMNQALFFPKGDTNILTIFIAWLNLDLGINTCFFDGMDAYSKTWLQFVFPLYIWGLNGLVIFLCSHSRRLTELCGGSNPVAVLATLFLISYLKVFRTIISTFSILMLDFPDGESRTVWQLDGNIDVLTGKHLVIFIFAILVFVFLFIPYTFLLLLGQWLPSFSHWRLLSWASSQRLRIFLETYHAPYKGKLRYWIGLQLVFRIVLAVVSNFAMAYDRSYSGQIYLITSSLVAVVFASVVWGWVMRGVYKKWTLDLLEGSFLLNLGLLSYTTAYVKINGRNQAAIVYTSVGIAFATFLVIVAHHTYLSLTKVKQVNAFLHSLRESIRPPAADPSASVASLQIRSNGDQPNSLSLPRRRYEPALRESLLSENPV